MNKYLITHLAGTHTYELMYMHTHARTHPHTHTHTEFYDLSQCHASTDSIRGEPLFFLFVVGGFIFNSPSLPLHAHAHAQTHRFFVCVQGRCRVWSSEDGEIIQFLPITYETQFLSE